MGAPRNKNLKMSIFTASKSLDVKYKFNESKYENTKCVLPAADIHAVLSCGVKGLLDTRTSMVTKKRNKKTGEYKRIYTQSINNVNIATAAITFLYSDTSTQEGYLGQDVLQKTIYVDVKIKKNQILSSKDFYTKEYKQPTVTPSKAGRDHTFNRLLTERVTALSNIAMNYDLPGEVVTTPDELNGWIKDPMFHETFHHSEQATMHYLSSALGLEYLLKNALDTKAAYLYGMVLDIFTERMLCCNCNACLLGMQNTNEAGFLHDFSNMLSHTRIEPRSGHNLMLSVRVSAQCGNKSATLDPLRLADDKKVVHEYNPKQTPQVFQAENKALGTEKIINDKKLSLESFPGTFFVSSTFSKDKLENEVRSLRRRNG